MGCHSAELARAFEGNSSECFPGLIPRSKANTESEPAEGSRVAHALEGPSQS